MTGKHYKNEVAYSHCPRCKSSFYGEGKNAREVIADAELNLHTKHTEDACERTQRSNKKSGL